LEFVATIKIGGVLRPEFSHDCFELGPEVSRLDSGSGKEFILYEGVEGVCDLEFADVHHGSEGNGPGQWDDEPKIVIPLALGEVDDVAVSVDVDGVGGGGFAESGHGAHVAADWVDEAGAD